MNRLSLIRRTAALLLATAVGAAIAQPAAPIRILVGFPPGGAPDVIARQFAEQLRLERGASVVVENRAGAAGKIAIEALLAAPADGQVVAVMPASALILVPMVVKSARYDVTRDFVALGSLAEYGFGIAAGPASATRDLPGFVAWSKAHPASAAFATPGLGTPQHFLGAQLAKALGVPLTHVPYRGGAPAANDVMGGQVPALITTEQLIAPHHEGGRLRALVVTSPARNPKMPDVPTAREAGLAELETRDWFGLFAKAGTPAARVAQWRRDVASVLQASAYRKGIEDMGYGFPGEQPDDFGKRLDADRAVWTQRVKTSGFQAGD